MPVAMHVECREQRAGRPVELVNGAGGPMAAVICPPVRRGICSLDRTAAVPLDAARELQGR